MIKHQKRRLPKKLMAVEGSNQLRYIILLVAIIFGIGTLGVALWLYMERHHAHPTEQVATASSHNEQTIDTLNISEELREHETTEPKTAESATNEMPLKSDDLEEDQLVDHDNNDDLLISIFKQSTTSTQEECSPTQVNEVISNTPTEALHPVAEEVALTQTSVDSTVVPLLPHCPHNALYFILETYEVPTLNQTTLASLDIPLIFAIVPLDQKLSAHMHVIQKLGQPFILDIPMAPQNHSVEAGPGTLHPNDTDKILKKIIRKNLRHTSGYQGVKNRMGSLFTANKEKMTFFMKALKQKGVLFIDSLTGKSVGRMVAKELKLPYAKRDIIIDAGCTEVTMHEQLNKAYVLTQKNGHAIVIMPATEALLKFLKTWLDKHPKAKNSVAPMVCLKSNEP